MNEERRERKGKAYWLVIMRPQFLTGGDTKGLRPSIPWIDREGGQSFWFFHVAKELNNGFFDASATYITALTLDTYRDDKRLVSLYLLLNSQNFCHSIPAGTENPLPSRLCYQKLWGSWNRRALILRWAYYLDAFSSYLLRTWLPSVYRWHDNWYTRVTTLPLGTVRSLRPTFVPARRVGLAVKLPYAFALEGQSPSGPRKPLHASVTFWEAYAP
ncbi:hypothetical protein V6N11_073137 [Hibiscus sabdariffa]|uniref:Uncharacterized protein n=1 Tax=Hibiscus sabdariffa TaxID=183260 RepID=A0ABR2P986_9ROSI